MGVDFLLNVIAIPNGALPDWAAAGRQIDGLELTDLQRYCEYWDPDLEALEYGVSDDDFLPMVKEGLHEYLGDLNEALAEPRGDTASFAFHGYSFHASGGLSAGSVPTELYDSISLLQAVGALKAAGFLPAMIDGGAYAGDRSPLDDSEVAWVLKFMRLAHRGRPFGPADNRTLAACGYRTGWRTAVIQLALDHFVATGKRNDAATIACGSCELLVTVDPDALLRVQAHGPAQAGRFTAEPRRALTNLGWQEAVRERPSGELGGFVQERGLSDPNAVSEVASLLAETLEKVYAVAPAEELALRFSYLDGEPTG